MTGDAQLLRSEQPPRLLSLVTSRAGATTRALGWADAGLTVRAIRGRKTRTVDALFNEFGAALQFPWYFGENWPAFNECICDLDWLPGRTGIVVLIFDAGQLLADGTQGDLRQLVRSIVDAGNTFGQPIDEGEWWDRPALPFHVVVQTEHLQELNSLKDAGATVADDVL